MLATVSLRTSRRDDMIDITRQAAARPLAGPLFLRI